METNGNLWKFIVFLQSVSMNFMSDWIWDFGFRICLGFRILDLEFINLIFCFWSLVLI